MSYGYTTLADAPDRAIAELARKQHGVVARRQLISAGLSATKSVVASEAAVSISPTAGSASWGVPPPRTRDGCPAGVRQGRGFSHRTAASVWELLPYPAAAPGSRHYPPERRIARTGIVAHRRRLKPRYIRRRPASRSPACPAIPDLAAELGGTARPMGDISHWSPKSATPPRLRSRAARTASVIRDGLGLASEPSPIFGRPRDAPAHRPRSRAISAPPQRDRRL